MICIILKMELLKTSYGIGEDSIHVLFSSLKYLF